jgi:hypothetical protein
VNQNIDICLFSFAGRYQCQRNLTPPFSVSLKPWHGDIPFFYWNPSTRLHSVTTQFTIICSVTAMKTSNLVQTNSVQDCSRVVFRAMGKLYYTMYLLQGSRETNIPSYIQFRIKNHMGRDHWKGSSSHQRRGALQWSGVVSRGQHEEEQTGSQHMHNSFPHAASLSDRCTNLSIRKQTDVSINTIWSIILQL